MDCRRGWGAVSAEEGGVAGASGFAGDEEEVEEDVRET